MRRSIMPKWALFAGALLILIAGILYIRNRLILSEIQAKLQSESKVVSTACGEIEYAIEGNGPPVLLVHATGGGYDQGLLMGRTWVGEGYQFIAPSRFGYLRTPVPDSPSVEKQADLFRCLLDSLGVQKVAVVGMSAGGPSAMQFAIRYPDRVAALVLMSTAAYVPPGYPNSAREFPSAEWVYDLLFSSDFLFGLIATYGSPMLEESFGATGEIKAALGDDENHLAADIVQGMLPITLRKAGLKLEKKFVDGLTEYSLERITAPTLVFSARDDKVGPFGWSEYTAGRIHNARFVLYDRGGHMLLGNRQKIAAAIDSLLAQAMPR